MEGAIKSDLPPGNPTLECVDFLAPFPPLCLFPCGGLCPGGSRYVGWPWPHHLGDSLD